MNYCENEKKDAENFINAVRLKQKYDEEGIDIHMSEILDRVDWHSSLGLFVHEFGKIHSSRILEVCQKILK